MADPILRAFSTSSIRPRREGPRKQSRTLPKRRGALDRSNRGCVGRLKAGTNLDEVADFSHASMSSHLYRPSDEARRRSILDKQAHRELLARFGSARDPDE